MSAPKQSLPKRCARAARGRDRRAGMLRPHAGSTVLACSRRASRAPALTLCRTRSNEGCSQLSVRPTELELRRSHSVQQVHLRLPLPRSAQIHLPRTARQPAHYDTCIRVSLYTTSCQPSATAATRGPACRPSLPFAQQQSTPRQDPLSASLRALVESGGAP